MEETWVRVPPSEVLTVDLDGLLACYSRLRGETHLLDAFPSEILKLLSSGPCTTQHIRSYLLELMGETTADWVARLEDALWQLEGIELVRKNPQ